MKSQNGMGHLMSIIFIFIIIAAIIGVVFVVKNQIKEEQLETYQTDMLLIQGKIKVIAQEAKIQKNDELLKGKKVEENIEDGEIKTLIEKKVISQDEESFSKYYILDKDNLNEIGLENISLKEGYYIVNYSTYEVIFSRGVNIENEIYYKLSDIKEHIEMKNNENSNEQANIETISEETKTEE